MVMTIMITVFKRCDTVKSSIPLPPSLEQKGTASSSEMFKNLPDYMASSVMRRL
jgi:hypothetical protein